VNGIKMIKKKIDKINELVNEWNKNDKEEDLEDRRR
jgi:hypothetical protein